MFNFNEYRLLCERSYKLSAELQDVDTRRAEMEGQFNAARVAGSNGAADLAAELKSAATRPADLAPPGSLFAFKGKRPVRKIDRDAHVKTIDFLLPYLVSHAQCTPETIVTAFGCSRLAAVGRLQKVAALGQVGPHKIRWQTGPVKLVRVDA